jgi:hypothetical protein
MDIIILGEIPILSLASVQYGGNKANYYIIIIMSCQSSMGLKFLRESYSISQCIPAK